MTVCCNLLIEEQDLLNNVETSLANHEFEIYIQPKCNMKTGLIGRRGSIGSLESSIKGTDSAYGFHSFI